MRVMQEGDACSVRLSGPGYSSVVRPYDSITRARRSSVRMERVALRAMAAGGFHLHDSRTLAAHRTPHLAGRLLTSAPAAPVPAVSRWRWIRCRPSWTTRPDASAGSAWGPARSDVVEQRPRSPVFTVGGSPTPGQFSCRLTPDPSERVAWSRALDNGEQSLDFAVSQLCGRNTSNGLVALDRLWRESADASWISVTPSEPRGVAGRDFDRVSFRVLVNASGACRTARVLLAGVPLDVSQGCGPGPLGATFSVNFIEVTQALQTPTNDVLLIAGRPTFVRVQFRTSGDVTTAPTVPLLVRRPFLGEVPEPVQPLPGQQATSWATPTRLAGTLIYRIPPHFLDGSTLEFTVETLPGEIIGKSETVEFASPTTLRAKVFPLSWSTSQGDGGPHQPSREHVEDARRQVMRILSFDRLHSDQGTGARLAGRGRARSDLEHRGRCHSPEGAESARRRDGTVRRRARWEGARRCRGLCRNEQPRGRWVE